MASHEVICKVLGYLVSKHKYGSPVRRIDAVNRSGVRSDQLGEAKDAFDELRKGAPFIEDCGKRGIQLDSSSFDLLANYLYVHCGWKVKDIRTRLKHYEGWSNHDWVPPE